MRRSGQEYKVARSPAQSLCKTVVLGNVLLAPRLSSGEMVCLIEDDTSEAESCQQPPPLALILLQCVDRGYHSQWAFPTRGAIILELDSQDGEMKTKAFQEFSLPLLD